MASEGEGRRGDVAAARREEILATTAALLLAHGMNGVKTRNVTEAVGVGTGLLNHYFRWADLRAMAWERIFAEVAKTQFPEGVEPGAVVDTWLGGAFTLGAEAYWRLWVEASDMAGADPALRAALGRVQLALHDGLAEALRRGTETGLWRLADPEATALRLGASADGLAGLLLSRAPYLDRARAEQALRRSFAIECAVSALA